MNIRGYKKKFSWEYENAFHWFSPLNRISKQIAHWELFKKCIDVQGDIFEIGVFKATTLIRWATYREIYKISDQKKIFAFDTFGTFPINILASTDDKDFVKKFTHDGGDGLDVDEVNNIMHNKNFKNFDLIKGDVTKTIPNFLKINPDVKISLLHLDVDIYEPTISSLKFLWDKLSIGGLLIIDDYKSVNGATDAVDEFLLDRNIKDVIHQSDFNFSPFYIVKS